MHRPTKPPGDLAARRGQRRARPRSLAMALAVAGLALASLAGVALAKSFTLHVAKNVKVSDILKPTAPTKTEAILVNSKGAAVYLLSGDGKRHPKCTSVKCLGFWPPVTVASAKAKLTEGPGAKGKLGIWHHKRMFQVTLNGHPLYTFSQDQKKGKALGEGIVSFGGTWHVFAASVKKGRQSNPSPAMNPPLPPGY
jgi:predicted lipoprotein with Yx(FWY)xxD motif